MRQYYVLLYALLFVFFSSFKPNQACEYAKSNISYVKSEIDKAIAMDDLQLVRFHTYKALNAIEKSKLQLSECGCDDAIANIAEGAEHLKQATKASSLASSVILLKKALVETSESLEALSTHKQHNTAYGNDVLTMNTSTSSKNIPSNHLYSQKKLRQAIDSSLTKYRESLDKVVNTVGCKEARDFANRIFENCEQELLKPNLSEGKKYYNLKTKEITAEALEKLSDCAR